MTIVGKRKRHSKGHLWGRSTRILFLGAGFGCVCVLLSNRNQLFAEDTKARSRESGSVCGLWRADSDTLDADCIDQIARVYNPRNNASEWCVPPSDHPNIFLKHPDLISDEQVSREPAVGIIFIKNTKAASSTGAGIALRIAEQVGQRLLPRQQIENSTNSLAALSCVRNWTHAFANHRGHSHRNPTRSLLWTVVRQPSKRDVSAFYFFEHARNGVEASDQNVLAYLEAQKSGQFRYLNTQYIADNHYQPAFQHWYAAHLSGMSDILVRLLKEYDFIAVAERWEESLAVMTILWELKIQDVIVLSSKTKGGYDDGKFQKRCHKIPEPQLSPAVQDYLQSKHFEQNLDVALYAAANASLDRTIHALGRTKVEFRVKILHWLQQKAEKSCMDVAVYPCTSEGVLQRAAAAQSCYIDDSGCGHDCVDVALRDAEDGGLPNKIVYRRRRFNKNVP
jgi:Galactose-3-O-sulfotransferase